MCGLDGRYNWHDGVDPSEAEFLARASSVHHLPDGETAVAYVGLYDSTGELIGDIGVYVSDLPEGLHTVYRVTVVDERIVDLRSGPEVHAAWLATHNRDR